LHQLGGISGSENETRSFRVKKGVGKTIITGTRGANFKKKEKWRRGHKIRELSS